VSRHEERRQHADAEEAGRKTFFAELGRALLPGGDVRVEGTARAAADRDHVHHVLLVAPPLD
jgi:hypothetical protein